eukprot:scaffold260682_cov19-Tisochrysis_lutea.AAC.1
MKQFLAEYGMIWVGDQHDNHQGADELSPRAANASASVLPPKPSAPNSKIAPPHSDASHSMPTSAPKAAASLASPREGGANFSAGVRHSVSSSIDAGEGKAAGVRSRGTSWSA